MRVLRMAGRTLTPEAIEGLVLCHDVGHGLRKGTRLTASHLPRLKELEEVHLARLDAGDVHEDDAARRLAAAVAGPGTTRSDPHQSQVRIMASRRGLLRVDREIVDRLNAVDKVSVFTLVDGQAVLAGEEVAGCKVTPVAVPQEVVVEAEQVAGEQGAPLSVVAFRPLRTFLVVTERLSDRARELFEDAVRSKLEWYGAELLEVREVARQGQAIRAAYAEARSREAELVLFAGASSIDPLDPAYAELEAVGGEVLRTGASAHPGSMLWLGRLGGASVLGIASCAGFGRQTALDLILPSVFANGQATARDLSSLGYGGLVEKGAGRRFPPYESAPKDAEASVSRS